MDHVVRQLEGKDCDVYFFRSCSGYSHPQKLIQAMTYESAIMNVYHRAWMCTEEGKQRFRLLELREVVRTPYLGSLPPGVPVAEDEFFLLVPDERSGWMMARQIDADESVDEPRFLHVRRYPESVLAEIVTVQTGYTFHYWYKPSGALAKLRVTNGDGNDNTMEF